MANILTVNFPFDQFAYRRSSSSFPVLSLIRQITGCHHKIEKKSVVIFRIFFETIWKIYSEKLVKNRIDDVIEDRKF